ncbi:hypothetical protein L210DRAFT_3761327 [Boletus edulis BED1]|uniref:DUF6534 domain-containing protein n=1 Tax=Boletus edulis BED1 TaxID=1328754 RepID=A0AAD4BRJ1_BOLED|nr:hypothetical protein L210DRAFT_3761327 [Boletus edulis BED1]
MSSGSPSTMAISLARGPLVGTFLGLILYGVTCVQAFFYFRTYERDGWRLKSTVALLVFLDTVHAALTMWVIDDYLIVKYADVAALDLATSCVPSIRLFLFLCVAVDIELFDKKALCVDIHARAGHRFLRVHVLYLADMVMSVQSSVCRLSEGDLIGIVRPVTKSKWVVVLMITISVSRTGKFGSSFSIPLTPRHLPVISILATILSASEPTLNDFLSNPRTRTLLLVGNTLFIIGDTFSASAMAYHLSKFKSWVHAPQRTRTRPQPQSQPRRIDTVLNRLFIFAVATGALTSLVDVIALILTVAQPNSFAFISTILIQTRLYANSLLASLNIRNAAARLFDDTSADPNNTHVELPTISLRFARPSEVSSESELEAGTGTGVDTQVAGDEGEGGRGTGRGHSTSKPDIESWQTTCVQNRTLLTHDHLI